MYNESPSTSREPDATGPDVLGLLLTSKCNLSCRHCCNESGPTHEGAVPFEELAALIDAARELPTVREIGISGGEPFLFPALLRRVVAHAARRGFGSSVTTNGFWARSRGAVRELDALRERGLRAVAISTSAFHQEFVSLERVALAARTVRERGLRATVNVVTSEGFGEEGVLAALDAGGDAASDGIDIVVMPCLPAGRARSEVGAGEFRARARVPEGNCREHFRKLAVDRDGDVYPCCSPGGFTPPLRMGNVRERSLSSIVEDSVNSALLAVLESVGPSYFLPFLHRRFGEGAFSAHYSDPCHLCHEILSSPACLEAIDGAAGALIPELRAADGAVAVSGARLERLVFHENVWSGRGRRRTRETASADEDGRSD